MALVRLEADIGMDPLNWLSRKKRTSMLGNLLPMSTEIAPWKMLSVTLSVKKLYKDSGGSPALRLLLASVSCGRPDMLTRLCGMVPSSWLRARSRTLSADMLANDADTSEGTYSSQQTGIHAQIRVTHGAHDAKHHHHLLNQVKKKKRGDDQTSTE